ncbi:MAG: PqqD family protein [bacterium]
MIERKVRAEHVLVPLHGEAGRLDSLYTLNETATLVWNAISEHLTDEQIAARMTEEYDVDSATAVADVQQVIRELLDIGAIVPVNTQTAS